MELCSEVKDLVLPGAYEAVDGLGRGVGLAKHNGQVVEQMVVLLHLLPRLYLPPNSQRLFRVARVRS